MSSFKRLTAVLIISIALIMGLSTLFSIDLKMLSSDIDILILASMASISVFVLKGLRFYAILRYSGVDIGLFNAVKVRFASEFFSLIGISFIGDELYRIYYLERMNVDRGEAISISYSEVFLEVLTAFVIILFGSLYSILTSSFNVYLGVGLVISLVIISGNILFIMGFHRFYRFLSMFMNKLGFKRFSGDYVSEAIKDFRNHFSNIVMSKKAFPVLMALSLFISIVSGLVLYIASVKYIPIHSFPLSLLVVYIANVISSLPITIGGLGVTEGVIISSFYSLGESLSVYVAILYRISSYVIPLIASAILLNFGMSRRA